MTAIRSNAPELASAVLYDAAHQQAAFYIIPQAGLLRVSGEDRLDFLQRQTSNDVRALKENFPVLSVLTSPTARILDVLYILPDGEDIELITLPGSAQNTANFLQRRIFFMDKVTISDQSDAFVQLDLVGPNAEIVLSELGGDAAPAGQRLFKVQAGETEVQILSREPSYSLGYRMIVPATGAAAFLDYLNDREIMQLNDEAYHWLRVEAGCPAVGAELTDAYTPLEVGLENAISDSKGCYTGQEIIARQMTYDKVTQHLVGMRLDGGVAPGEKIWSGEKSVGLVTSTARSPRFGDIALGIIKRPYHQPGNPVRIGDLKGGGQSGEVVQLPFASA